MAETSPKASGNDKMTVLPGRFGCSIRHTGAVLSSCRTGRIHHEASSPAPKPGTAADGLRGLQ